MSTDQNRAKNKRHVILYKYIITTSLLVLFILMIAGVKRGRIIVFKNLGDLAFALFFLGLPPMLHILYPFAPSPLRFTLALAICTGFIYNFMISFWQNGGMFKAMYAGIARYLLSVYLVFGTVSYFIAKPRTHTPEVIFVIITAVVVAATLSRWRFSDPFKYFVPSYIKKNH